MFQQQREINLKDMTLTKEIKKLEALILKAKKENNALYVANYTRALNKMIEANEWLIAANCYII